ncbi:V-type ATP synthase subunit D [Treponema parvum]|uniref:V-type ATP synthase subunit D n=1 Tax=Treponema parvum TaxID=138851 RepID=UPI001AEBC60F|nr:V-type ATP synthase subunit D [Treponema parvum]QTQ16703.1 V-type ATP synthase subunit D [Treponema parvum]
MAKLNIAPTKSNLLKMNEQLAVSQSGYDLLEQKREILVMELMHMVERVKLLERDIDKVVTNAYPALKKMLIAAGMDRMEQLSHSVQYDFTIREKPVTIGGMKFHSIDVELPPRRLFYSLLGTLAEGDKVMAEFFKLLTLLAQMASIRTIVWRLAGEVKKTQRRVNALNKMVIPQALDTKKYIESVLEERERESVFVLKSLKRRKG